MGEFSGNINYMTRLLTEVLNVSPKLVNSEKTTIELSICDLIRQYKNCGQTEGVFDFGFGRLTISFTKTGDISYSFSPSPRFEERLIESLYTNDRTDIEKRLQNVLNTVVKSGYRDIL